MSTIPLVKLNTGAYMPAVGLGTWSGWTQEENDSAKTWILTALQNGYRALDTAFAYGTEKVVGQAIRESGLKREDIFVTTKLPSRHHDRVQKSLEMSLERSGLDYFDLYLIHWPQAYVYRDEDYKGKSELAEDITISQTWAQMEEVLASGKVKAIGVSNFSEKTLDIVLANAKVVPAVNQVEMHPYLSQVPLKTYCDARGIVLTAYTPSGYGTVRADPVMEEIAKKHGASTAQVAFAWHVARGTTLCPKSTNVERQKENLSLPKLDEEDIKRIDALNKDQRLCNKPDKNGKVFGSTMEQLGW